MNGYQERMQDGCRQVDTDARVPSNFTDEYYKYLIRFTEASISEWTRWQDRAENS
jgi:hypothetical protein